MEELLLRALLVGEELDVVDQDHVGPAERIAEGRRAAVADRLDEGAGELLDRRVADAQAHAEAAHVVADRVEEVRLAEARRAMKEERVVGLSRHLGRGQRGRVGEAVPVADHELLEGVLGVEAGLGGGGTRLGRSRLGRAPVGPHDLDDHPVTELPHCGPAQEREVALAHAAADVLRCPDVERVALEARGLERRQPDVELQVRGLAPKLFPDTAPDWLDLFGHGLSASLLEDSFGDGWLWRDLAALRPLTCPRRGRVYTCDWGVKAGRLRPLGATPQIA